MTDKIKSPYNFTVEFLQAGTIYVALRKKRKYVYPKGQEHMNRTENYVVMSSFIMIFPSLFTETRVRWEKRKIAKQFCDLEAKQDLQDQINFGATNCC